MQKVDLRFALAETDSQLQLALQLYLAPVLLKLASPNADVRQAVFALIKNTFPRILAARDLQLPVDALLEQALRPAVGAPADPGPVALYSLLFLSKGVDRMPPEAQRALVPKVIAGIASSPNPVAARMFSILVKLLRVWVVPEKGSTDAENMPALLFSGAERSERYLCLLIARFFLLLPNPGPNVVQMPGLSFDQANFFTRDAGVSYKTAGELNDAKIRLLDFLRVGFSDSALVLPLLVASLDPLSAINEPAYTRFRKLDYVLTPPMIDLLVLLFTGVPNESPPVKEVLQDKILALLYKADMARHPQLSVVCDIGLLSSYARLRQTATSFVKKVTLDANKLTDRQFNSSIALKLKESIMAEGWPVSNLSQSHTSRAILALRELLYEALCDVMRNSPLLWTHDMGYLQFFFDSLEREPADLRLCLQNCLSSLAIHLQLLSAESKNRLKKIAQGYLSSANPDPCFAACRYISVKYVNACFPFLDPEARFLCLLGSCHVNGPETVDEARRGLDPYLFNLTSDLLLFGLKSALVFPSFLEMVVTLHDASLEDSPLRDCLGEAIKFALKLLVMLAVEGKSTVVVVDEDWGPRIEKALETDKSVRELLAAEIRVRSTCDVPMEDEESVTKDPIFVLIQMCFQALEREKALLGPILRLLVSLSPPKMVALLGIFVDPLLKLVGGNSLSDATTKDLCEVLAVIATHPVHEENVIKGVLSSLDDMSIGACILGTAYMISRLALRQRLDVLGFDIIHSYVNQLTQYFENARFYDLCADAVAQLSIFGVLGPKLLDQESVGKAQLFRSLLLPRAKACHEKLVLALASFELAHAELYQDSSLEPLAIEELVFSTHVSKQYDFLFASGDALLILAGGWNCEFLQQNVDIQGESIAYVPQTTGRMGPILLHILKSTLVTKPSLRRASCIWLLAMVQHLSHAPEIRDRAADIHFAFMRFLTDKDEIIQESAARGLSIVYELGDADLKETLVKGLIRSFTDSNTASQLSAGTVDHETQLFEKDVLRTHDSSVSTYKDVLNLAQDVGDPSLVYKFMSLAKSNALWSSRKGMAYGLGSVLLKSSLDNMLAKDEKLSRRLIPKLYRYRFDPNASVSRSMNDIWKSLIRDDAKTVGANFEIILQELVSGMGSREWRTRQASAVALGNLLQTQPEEKYGHRLEEIWTVCFRSMDDVKESVRKEGLQLAQSLAKLLVRTADLSTSKATEGQATRVVDNLVPFLMGSKGLLSDAEEVRTFALDTVLKLCKLGGKPIRAHVPRLLGQLIELMSSLEPEVVNYLVLNAEKYNLSANDVDTQRLQSLGHSPLMDGIEKLLGLVDESMISEVVQELKRAIKKSVGLPSKACASRVVVQLISGSGFIMAPYASGLLDACTTQFKDKSPAVSQSFAVAAGYCCKLADIEAVVRYSKRLHEMYLGAEDAHSRWLAAVGYEAVGKHCGSDKFESVSAAFLPVIFIGKHDEDPSVALVFEKAWIENAPGISAAKVYFSDIFEICKGMVKSHDHKLRQLVARTMVDLCDSLKSFSDAELATLFTVLLDACTGKSWSGKEMVLKALVTLATRNAQYVRDHPGTLGMIEKTVMTEQNRRNVAYQAKAVLVSACFLKVFPNKEILDSYMQIMDSVLSDDYFREAELVEADEPDYEKMTDVEAVALEEVHLQYLQSVLQAICFEPLNLELVKFLFAAMQKFRPTDSNHRPLTWRTCRAYNDMFCTVLQGYTAEMPVRVLSENFPILIGFDDAYKIEKDAVAFVRNAQLLAKVLQPSDPVLERLHVYLRKLALASPSSVVRNEITIALA